MNVLRNELKYHVQARVISSEPWVPQKRERIFIVGFRSETDFDFDALELPAKSAGPKLGSILEPHDEVDPKRSEEHTSELQSLMRISYAVFCLKKKNTENIQKNTDHNNN